MSSNGADRAAAEAAATMQGEEYPYTQGTRSDYEQFLPQASSVHALNSIHEQQQFEHVESSGAMFESDIQDLSSAYPDQAAMDSAMETALAGGRGDEVMEQLLQQIMAEQQMQQQLVQEQIEAAAREAILARPKEHYITVTHNGTIIAATETITGASPNELLMTSIFDGVHHEDLQGLHATKDKVWDKGNLDVVANLRRQTAEGEWIWLVAKVASFVDYPVPSFVLHECRATDDYTSAFFSRLTRTIASLADAMEIANEGTVTSQGDGSGSVGSYGSMQDSSSVFGNASIDSIGIIPGLADDAAMLQQLLAEATGGADSSINKSNSSKLQQLIDAATRGGAFSLDSSVTSESSLNTETKNFRAASAKLKGLKGTDTPSVLELVSSGPCVNISKIELSLVELKIVVLVMKGELTIETLTLLLTEKNVRSAEDLSKLVDEFLSEKAKTEVIEPGKVLSSKHRQDSMETLKSSNSQAPTKQRNQPIGNTSLLESGIHFSLPLHQSLGAEMSPAIASINLSCSRAGNLGLEKLSEIIQWDTPSLKMLDLSFCNVEESGILTMCRSLRKRRKRGLPGLEGLILSGNLISYKSAKELGLALSMAEVGKGRQIIREPILEGHDEDNEGGHDDDDNDDDDEGDGVFGAGNGKTYVTKRKSSEKLKKERKSLRITDKDHTGIQLLHLASTSLSSDGLGQLMAGLGRECQIRELNIASNNIGADGATPFVQFLEGKFDGNETRLKGRKTVMPKLDRIDLSGNNLGDDGTAKIAKAISNRGKLSMVDLHLSFNGIGSGGTGTIMNKLLQHNLVTLSLDNNTIGDAGCQLVAGSLTSMHHLSELCLSFNQIGSRGITSLMRALIGCESIQHLGLSGNIMKISGAIAMGFALAQHPRLSCLELDNCCLSQVSQCHIVAGIISNRWVPMRNLHGFQVAPAMDVIGVPEVQAWHAENDGSHLKNEDCFSNRRNMQMKIILQWMETNRAAEKAGTLKKIDVNDSTPESSENNFLTVDFVSVNNDVNDTPSQNAYLRMLDWLSRIPFDEDELSDLRRYFYDADDGGDGLRGSDGNINLKHRGDLLAALGSGLAEKIRQEGTNVSFPDGPSVGLGIDDSDSESDGEESSSSTRKDERTGPVDTNRSAYHKLIKRRQNSTGLFIERWTPKKLGHSQSEASMNSTGEPKPNKSLKARITMFPIFMKRLELLKVSAQDMMDGEVDDSHQDMIAQLFAEKSLTLLRQLRYHCMNNGLDGWRQGKIRRKILVVDDSKITRKLVARAFQKANFIVDTAENGEEGVRMLKESIYDIAFMDIDMPVMNGFDATKALREWEDLERPGARQPICALTAAYVEDFEREELMKFKEAGLDVMESKPCNIPRLFKVVDDVSPMFSDLSITVTQQFDTATATC